MVGAFLGCFVIGSSPRKQEEDSVCDDRLAVRLQHSVEKHRPLLCFSNNTTLPQSNQANDEYHGCARENGPERGSEAIHQCHLLSCLRVLRDRRGDGCRHGKPEGVTELGNLVEDPPSQRLYMGGECLGDQLVGNAKQNCDLLSATAPERPCWVRATYPKGSRGIRKGPRKGGTSSFRTWRRWP